MGQAKDAATKPVKALFVEGAKAITSLVASDEPQKAAVTVARMSKKQVPRSDAFEAIHSAATALHAAGVVDENAMREYDAGCFKPPSFTARDVQRIRRKERISQEVLARYMGITKATVARWESAHTKPSPMAQRLLKVIDEQGIDALA